MATVRLNYAAAQALTVTGLATLANGSSATSATIDNSSDSYMDIAFEVRVTTGSGATSTGTVEIYVKGSIDNTDFDDNANDKWLATLALDAGGAASYTRIALAAAAFGGVLPPYIQVRVRNATGASLTAGTVAYLGVTFQSE